MADKPSFLQKLLDSLMNSQTFKPNQKPANPKSAGGKDAKGRTTFGAGVTKGPEKKPGEGKGKKSSFVIKEERLEEEAQPSGAADGTAAGAPSTEAAGHGSKGATASAVSPKSGAAGSSNTAAGKGRKQNPNKSKKDAEKQPFDWRGFIQKLNPSKSVGMKLFLFFFVSIFVIVSVVGAFSFSTARDIIKQKVTFSSTQTLIQTADKIDNQLGTFEALSTQMLLNQELKKLLENMRRSEISEVERRNYIKRGIDIVTAYMTADKNIFQIDLFQRIGYRNATDSGMADTVMIKSVNDGGDVNVKSTYFEEWMARADLANGDPVWFPSKPGGIMDTYYQPTFNLTRVLKNIQKPNAEVIMTMDINTAMFKTALESVNLGEGGYTFVADVDNRLIYDPDRNKLGTPSLIPFDVNNKEPNGAYLSRSPDGQQILVVYANLKRVPWRVIGHFPVEELVKDANKIAVITLVMIVLAIAIAIALGFIIARMIGTPLQALRNLMKQGEQGVLSVRTQFETEDEIGQVGHSFNSMMTEITSLVIKTNDSAQQVLDKSYELSDASRQTATSVREISTSTEHISHGALDLAMQAEKVGQLTQNLSDQIRSVTDINDQMATTANDVQDASQRGVDQMEVLTYKSNQIERITSSMITKVDKLKESTDSIQKILSLLTNIAKQTNILAINAGIEAARAGVHGKGFMVVANEVRKLADQSKESIKLVEGVTHLIQQEVEETVVVLKDAYPMFQEQLMSVKEVDEIFKDVQGKMELFIDQIDTSTHSIESLAGAQNVLADAVSSVSAISEESSATAEEVASLTQSQLVYTDNMVDISQGLENLSRELRESLSRFKTD